MKKRRMRGIAWVCSAAVIFGTIGNMAPMHVNADASDLAQRANVFLDNGGYKTEALGTVTDDYMNSYKNRADVLPKLDNAYLTDRYKREVATVPTSDWASSVVFDQFSESLYVHPMAFRATDAGMEMATPAVIDVEYHTDNEPAVESLLDDSSVELVMGGTDFTAKDARVDVNTDWTYEILMENEAGNSMRTTLAKGSPYVYYQFTDMTPTLSLGGGATNMMIYMNDTDSNSIGVSVTNNTDGTTHYYGVYASDGAAWVNADNCLTAQLPEGKAWITVAALPDGSDETFAFYEQYAANRISDTRVDWSYSEGESKVRTTYQVTTTDMDTNQSGGDTIMALYPHQWRYAKNVSYTGLEYQTIRGAMKTTLGTAYVTEMTYNGILSAMPTPASEEGLGTLKEQIGYFWDYYENQCDGTYSEPGDWQYGGYDTYWMGKNLNKRTDIICMAEQIEDDSEEWSQIKEDILSGVQSELQYWFNPADCYTVNSDPYITGFFHYYEDFGTLIGYNSSYGTDRELNDHHFHYGYWIKAAAAVATYVEDWEKGWGALVYEMISDIANPNRDGTNLNVQRTDVQIDSNTKYPFLRNFDIYEGHSWASGVANYEYDENGQMNDPQGGLAGGNNQESTSEAVNAWSSLILWGEAVGDERIRDLGVYLYTTEVAAIEDYYFDMYDEIFTDAYEDKGDFDLNVVTRMFGGRYDHTAWWTENPIEVTAIHMIPMTASTLYFSKFPQKVEDTYNSIWGKQWNNYITLKEQNNWQMLDSKYTHQDLLAEFYAMADPEAAMEKWSIDDINGQTVIEHGESRAHTYGFIQSMVEFGTPNFEVTGSSATSMVFEKDGVRTYTAQNFTDAEKTVYFSDGAYITVPAKGVYAGQKDGDGENPGVGKEVSYEVETYLENLDGTYEKRAETKKAPAGEISYTVESIQGFTFDEKAADNVLTATLVAGQNDAVKLKAYYVRNNYAIKYELNGGKNDSENPDSYKYGTEVKLKNPSKEGNQFTGWFTDAALTQEIKEISSTQIEDLKLYAGWKEKTTGTPKKVENVAAVYTDGVVTVTWEASEGAEDYQVSRFDSISGNYTTLCYRTDGTSYADQGVEPGVEYRYRITAWCRGENNEVLNAEISDAAVVSVECRTEPPAKVENVSAVYADGAVTVTWDASEGATDYMISRFDAKSGCYTALAYRTKGTTFVDDQVEKGILYRYRITAWSSGEGGKTLEAPLSDAAVAGVDMNTEAPAKVQNVKAVYVNGEVTVSWEASEGADSYTVNRYDTETKQYTALTYSAGKDGYKDSSVKEGVIYTYRITAWSYGEDGTVLNADISDAATVNLGTKGILEKLTSLFGA